MLEADLDLVLRFLNIEIIYYIIKKTTKGYFKRNMKGVIIEFHLTVFDSISSNQSIFPFGIKE